MKIKTPNMQIIINGIAIDPNFTKSEKLNLIPKNIIPNFFKILIIYGKIIF